MHCCPSAMPPKCIATAMPCFLPIVTNLLLAHLSWLSQWHATPCLPNGMLPQCNATPCCPMPSQWHGAPMACHSNAMSLYAATRPSAHPSILYHSLPLILVLNHIYCPLQCAINIPLILVPISYTHQPIHLHWVQLTPQPTHLQWL